MKVAGRTIREYQRIWDAKPSLRSVYADLYRRMALHCLEGRTLEVGGGIGNFKQFAPQVISSDIQAVPWLDVVCDAHDLPFGDGSFANVVVFDVMHHLEHPRRFLSEIERVLLPGGRAVMMEASITPVSWLFYKFLHAEPCAMGEYPLADGPRNPKRDPYDANQAIPELLFGRYRKEFEYLFPRLRIAVKKRLSLFAYPLSGGYKPWSLIPSGMVGPILRLETILMPILGPLMAFRLLIVLQKEG